MSALSLLSPTLWFGCVVSGVLLASGCTGDKPAPSDAGETADSGGPDSGDSDSGDSDSADSGSGDTRWTGLSADEGYGSAIAGGGDAAGGPYVGAPYAGDGGLAAGSVYLGGLRLLDGSPGDRLGRALALRADGTLLVGAPGPGEVRGLDNVPLLAEAGAGGCLAASGTSWATGTRLGATRWTGAGFSAVPWGAPAASLVFLDDGRLVGGFVYGAMALRLDDGTSVARVQPQDEAGYVLLLADADGDGASDLLVGAPGAGRVYVLDPAHLPASLADARTIEAAGGRFGASLAVPRAGTLFIGAPMAGEEAQGAVWRVDGLGAPGLVYTGPSAGDQLGASLAVGPDGTLLMGSPGAATVPGAVDAATP